MPLLSLDTSARAPYERLPENASASEDDDSELELDDGDGPPSKKKRWWMYLPLLLLIALMFTPHYSILVMLISYYLRIYYSPYLFTIHLSMMYLFTFLACCSLLVCVVRDPGAIRVGEDASSHSHSRSNSREESEDENEEADMLDALRMTPKKGSGEPQTFSDDFNAPHKWCRKCWAPKPERTHHCSSCGRCVLKMDHHCPWLAHKCVGYWTYTAFLHFLLCITLLAIYVGLVAGRIVYVAFEEPFLIDERTALHALFLTLYGAVFALVVGSFFLWHVYLASTNQTTVENISPFLLLRYLPTSPPPPVHAHVPLSASASLAYTGATIVPPAPAGHSVSLNSPTPSRPLSLHPISLSLSSQPGTPPNAASNSSFPFTQSIQRTRSVTPVPNSRIGPNAQPTLHEHQLTSAQRRTVRYFHGRIRLYDVGFRANWGQILGVGKRGWRGWVYRVLCGGGGAGGGRTFPRNSRAEALLARLAEELGKEDKMD